MLFGLERPKELVSSTFDHDGGLEVASAELTLIALQRTEAEAAVEWSCKLAECSSI